MATYSFQLKHGSKTQDVTLTFETKMTQFDKRVDEKGKKRLIKEAFEYLYQTHMGRSIMEVVCKRELKLIFYNNNAYDPDLQAIKWNPELFCWYVDTARTWPRRERDFPSGFQGKVPRRPDDAEYQFTNAGWFGRSTPAPVVLGLAGPPNMLLHELGHRTQHLMRPHVFSKDYKEAGKKNKHLVEGGHADDLDWPWEVDNVNWREIPFAKDLRTLGICEGIRWTYKDVATTFWADDWTLVDVRGVKALKLQHRADKLWYRAGCFWELQAGGRMTEVFNTEHIEAQKRIDGGFGRIARMKPNQAEIDRWFTTYGPGTGGATAATGT